MEVNINGREKQRRRTLDRAIKACTLLNGGMTVQQVAKRYKVSRVTVYRWAELVVSYGHESTQTDNK